MFEYLFLLIGLTAPDYTASVAVETAYALRSVPKVTVKECCGACKRGVITHGDGHKTPCPCPGDCKCKSVTHPPVFLKCESGTCTLKR